MSFWFFFSLFYWGDGVWKEYHRRNMPFSPHHIKGIQYQHKLVFDVDLDHVAKEISVRILLSKATLLPPIFPDHKFWSEVTSCTLNCGIKVMLHLLNREYLYKFLEICIEDLSVLMCVCMYSLIQSFIYTSGDSWQCIFCFGL